MSLREVYWPTSRTGDYLDTARRRSLASFSLLGALCGTAINIAYFEKNFFHYPQQGICVLVISVLLAAAPFLMRRSRRVETAAMIIVWGCFVLIGAMSLAIDGMLSLKAMLFLPLAMVVTLTLNWRHGVAFGLCAVLLFIVLHAVRGNIGGNMIDDMTVDELSLMMLVGLSISIVFIITGASIFSIQITTTMEKLKLATRAAEASNEAKTQFLANMSHEIRTPMHGVIGLTELLEASPLNDRQRQYVTTVKDSASTLVTILNDILDASRLEAGQLQLHKAPFDLRAMCENVCLLFTGEAQRKQLELSVQYDNSLPDCFEGDADRMRQILLNLVANAIKFTDFGYVQLRVRGRQTTTQTHLHIAIADSGLGVPASQTEAIFERFAQASPQERAGGAGLGLAICRGLAEAMRGTLNVTANEPAGSIFFLLVALRTARVQNNEAEEVNSSLNTNQLPRMSSATDAESPVTRHLNHTGEARVLIAEDNEVNRMFLTHFLRSKNFAFEFAENGVVAVEKATAGHFDLVLMDISMPLLNGIEATRQIRQLETDTGRSPIPIIAVTASAIPGDRERFLAAGMNDYLPKPYRIDEFQNMLTNWLPGAVREA